MMNQQEEKQVNFTYLKAKIDLKLNKILSFLKTEELEYMQPVEIANVHRKMHRRTHTEPNELIIKEDQQSTTLVHSEYPLTSRKEDTSLGDISGIQHKHNISSNKTIGETCTQRQNGTNKSKIGVKSYRVGLSEKNLESDFSKITGKLQDCHKNPLFEETLRKRKNQAPQQNKQALKRNPVNAKVFQELAAAVTKSYIAQRKQTSQSYLTRSKFIDRLAKKDNKSKKN